ncbi:MAG: methyltransferase domain-containing protein [Candidatus Eisenbacteria bacterium]
MTDEELQRDHLIARLAPKRGESILDLGCGSGEDLEHILRVRRGVRVVGMDRSERMLRGARRRLSRYIKREAAEIVVGDAGEALPFPSRSFDAVLSAELMECLPPVRQTRLLKEIHRVLKPKGRVLIEHTDWDTQVWNAKDRRLERKLVHSFCDWTQGWMDVSDGWMGRKLLGLLRQSKLFKRLEVDTYVLTNDQYKPGAYGHARAQDLLTLARARKGVQVEDARRFLRDLKAQDRAATYFYSVTRYLILAKSVPPSNFR